MDYFAVYLYGRAGMSDGVNSELPERCQRMQNFF
jgi:hypothetical protein